MTSLIRKNSFAALALAFLMALPLSLMASTRTRPAIKVDFHHPVNIGTTVVPPGHYRFVQVPSRSDRPQFIVINSEGKHLAMTAIGNPVVDTGSNRTPTTSNVVLKNVNGQYYLSEIWVQGLHRGYQFPLPQSTK